MYAWSKAWERWERASTPPHPSGGKHQSVSIFYAMEAATENARAARRVVLASTWDTVQNNAECDPRFVSVAWRGSPRGKIREIGEIRAAVERVERVERLRGLRAEVIATRAFTLA